MLEVVVGVVGVAMNWLSTCVHDILCRDGREGYNVHLSIIWNRKKVRGFKRRVPGHGMLTLP